MKRSVWAPFLLLALLASGHSAFATAVVNGFGGGSVAVSVWCNPNAPPAAPNAAAGGTSGALGPGVSISIPGTVALPAACNPGTNISGTNAALWSTTWAWAEAGGDKTAGDGTTLLETLTPVSYFSSGSLVVSGSIVDPTDALFTGTYSLSDSGVAYSIEWFSVLGNTMVASIPETKGAASGTINMLVNDPFATGDPNGIASDLKMETDVAGTSLVPEPSTFSLVMSGFGCCSSLIWKLRRKQELR